MSDANDIQDVEEEKTENGVMELDCWKGDWGLPSVDTKCLNILAYAKFAGAPIKVNKQMKLWRNLRVRFPVFRSAQTVLDSDREVIEHLRVNDFNADAELSDQQRADILAYTALLEEKLLPALLHTWWVDARNYTEFSRPWYAEALQFPFNYFTPGHLHRVAETKVEVTRGGDHLQQDEVKQIVLKDAKECLNLLSERLGKEDFFFGNAPTSLDAVVFSHIAPLLKAPLPSAQLQHHLKCCDNLCRFCSRIVQRYFPLDPNATPPKKTNNTPKPHGEDSYDDPHKTRNQIFAVIFATAAMIGYALVSGLVKLQIVDSDQGGVEFEYDVADDDEGGDSEQN
ncbi:metaxin-1-like [Amphiura filiformis]|uniref:metaxin-1-like n=1 Tax=Amphiura filiformis TaxID=82378 RepID=UPI003B210DAB